MSFSSLGLAEPLLRAVEEKGYTQASPIQAQAIPAILEGRDVMGAAQTGTGKTAGFTLPLLQRLSEGAPVKANRVRALVLAPTRELAAQVSESVDTYGKYMKLRSVVVYGGVKINPQMQNLRKGADILVATPGRLLDLYQQNAIRFDDLEILVLDEADKMLDMGFIRDIQRILDLLPKERQNLLFSATFSGDIRALAKSLMTRPPLEINVNPKETTATTVQQWLHPVDKARKAELLSHLIRTRDWRQVLVFTKTKHGANKLVTVLARDGIRAAAIHGNKSQSARMKALEDFKRGRVSILIATDIAARGIDIVELPHVVNYDLPNVPEDYVHRIGRTGRAGAKGKAISLVSADEYKQLWDIERLIKRKLTRDEINGFEPEHRLPESKSLNAPIRQPKKPKVKKPAHSAAPGKPKASRDPQSRQHSSRQQEARQPDTRRETGKSRSAGTSRSAAGGAASSGSTRTGTGRPANTARPRRPHTGTGRKPA